VLGRLSNFPQEQRKIIRGWCFYDWGNSAFSTSIMVAILPPYFVAIFKDVYPQGLDFGPFTFTASSIWALAIALATGVIAFSSPILGAISDTRKIKKKILVIYTYIGCFATLLLFFSVYTGFEWAWLLMCATLANAGFLGAWVFYNALLPKIVSEESIDYVSSLGFAYGYIGGGLLLAIHLVAIIYFDSSDFVIRISMASVAVWWFFSALITFKNVPEPEVDSVYENDKMSISEAFNQVIGTLKKVSKFRTIFLYLIAYLIFNDAIQTIISVAGVFGPDVLGVTLQINMVTILIIQFIAAPGAMAFSIFANKIGSQKALLIALFGWAFIVVIALGFAPLTPKDQSDYDIQIKSLDESRYEIVAIPSSIEKPTKSFEVLENYSIGDQIDEKTVKEIKKIVLEENLSSYSLYIDGGSEIVSGIGSSHKSILNDSLSVWPKFMRSILWEPLGITVSLQWIFLGIFVGFVMGGSQALARSLFAVIIPKEQSGEFFGFFGFVGRFSATIGPILYGIVAGLIDPRFGVFSLLIILLIGTIMLWRINLDSVLNKN
tara:strand:- start:586 stop:2229 length:1644 start_codon:yes stop_codon:yes gene_type:complete